MGIKYNIDLLAASGEFGAGAARGLRNGEDSFNKLTEFLQDFKNYLRLYNPTVVVYSPDIRQDFLNDIAKIQELLGPLKMTRVLAELDNLRDAVNDGNEKGLSDGLVKFFAGLEITADAVSKAMIPDIPGVFNLDRILHTEKEIVFAIDERPDILTAITEILEDTFRVISMTDGRIAIKATEIYEPALFIIDIVIGDMNGFELAEKIRDNEKFKNTPILFLFDGEAQAYAAKVEALGSCDYLIKPVKKDVLSSKVGSVLG